MSANRILLEGFPEDWLSAYLDNQLSRSRCRQVEAALAMNPELAEMLEELKASRQLVKQLPSYIGSGPQSSMVQFLSGDLGGFHELNLDLEDGLESTLAKPITQDRAESVRPQLSAQAHPQSLAQLKAASADRMLPIENDAPELSAVVESPDVASPAATVSVAATLSQPTEESESEDTVDLDQESSIAGTIEHQNVQDLQNAQDQQNIDELQNTQALSLEPDSQVSPPEPDAAPTENMLITEPIHVDSQKDSVAEAIDSDLPLTNPADVLDDTDQVSEKSQPTGGTGLALVAAKTGWLLSRNWKPLAIAASLTGILLTGSALWRSFDSDNTAVSMSQPAATQATVGTQSMAPAGSASELARDGLQAQGPEQARQLSAPAPSQPMAKSLAVDPHVEQPSAADSNVEEPSIAESHVAESSAETMTAEASQRIDSVTTYPSFAASPDETVSAIPASDIPDLAAASGATEQSQTLDKAPNTALIQPSDPPSEQEGKAVAAAELAFESTEPALEAAESALDIAQTQQQSVESESVAPVPPAIQQQSSYQLPPDAEVSWHRSQRWTQEAAVEQFKNNSLLAPLRRALRSASPGAVPRQEPSKAQSKASGNESIPIAVYRLLAEQSAEVARRAEAMQLQPAWNNHPDAKSRFLFLSEEERQQLFPQTETVSDKEIFWVNPIDRSSSTDLRIIILNKD
ncbi:MAG TPA: hypothetical protein DCF63_00060 [Planctomycetaceae bacterium]|nr:hypothetical protein [Planctomycetaceae bacterium]